MRLSHKDYGLTDEAFLGLVEFYRELIRLDEDIDGRMLRRNQRTLVAILKLRIAVLKKEKQKELLRQLEGLENL